ncbi:MAG TPA: hypothetical protein VNI83_06470, partial [Vicinamibacterales bacterium]|nr:hypothetical protein [Vicinamibacterales bacterium]
MALLLFAVYTAPGVFLIAGRPFYWPFHVIWLAGLAGLALSSGLARWSLPPLLRAPLALWALAIAGGGLVAAAREADFTIATLADFGVRNAGVPARIVVEWIAFVSAGTLTGILWLDWLYARFADRPAAFARTILAPLGIGWLAATVAGLYQAHVDITFLNPGFWATIGRATGTLDDANPFGAVCAMWGPLAAGLALLLPRWPARLAGAAVALALGWAGVWASASRGAFVIAAAGTA